MTQVRVISCGSTIELEDQINKFLKLCPEYKVKDIKLSEVASNQLYQGGWTALIIYET